MRDDPDIRLGLQSGPLHRALVGAFPELSDFLALVQQCLGQAALDDLSSPTSLNAAVFEVILYADRHAVIGRLIRGALAAQPTAVALQVVAGQVLGAPPVVADVTPEAAAVDADTSGD